MITHCNRLISSSFVLRGFCRVTTLALLLATMASPAKATFKSLYSFSAGYADGAHPIGQMAASGGALYGVTSSGVNGFGSLFKMTTAGAFTVLHHFRSSLRYDTSRRGERSAAAVQPDDGVVGVLGVPCGLDGRRGERFA